MSNSITSDPIYLDQAASPRLYSYTFGTPGAKTEQAKFGEFLK